MFDESGCTQCKITVESLLIVRIIYYPFYFNLVFSEIQEF